MRSSAAPSPRHARQRPPPPPRRARQLWRRRPMACSTAAGPLTAEYFGGVPPRARQSTPRGMLGSAPHRGVLDSFGGAAPWRARRRQGPSPRHRRRRSPTARARRRHCGALTPSLLTAAYAAARLPHRGALYSGPRSSGASPMRCAVLLVLPACRSAAASGGHREREKDSVVERAWEWIRCRRD
jgi:hypothetical protein